MTQPSAIKKSTAPVPENPQQLRLIHKAHSGTQADIWLVKTSGGDRVLRDYSSSRSPLSRVVSRWAVRREIRAHQLLESTTGIPKLIEVLDKDRYLIEYIEGFPLSEKREFPHPDFFERLAQLIASMHARGVAHGDLRNKNIMVGPNIQPYIVDFTTAWWDSWWRRPLFIFYKRLDLRRLARTKEKYTPDDLTDAEEKMLKVLPWYLWIGRFYRYQVYRRLCGRGD